MMGRKVSLSDDSIKAVVKPDLDRARAWQDVLRPQRERFLMLYSMSREAEGIRHLNKDGFSQMVAPLVYESVEGMKVGLDQLFTSPDFFAVTVGKDVDAGERIRKLLRWNIFEAQYGAREIRFWLDTTLKYHYGVLKVFWDEEYREETQDVPELAQEQAEQLLGQGWEMVKFKEIMGEQPAVDELGLPVLGNDGLPLTEPVLLGLKNVKLARKAPVFIGPRLAAVDPEAFFYSPDSPDLDKCRVVAHRVRKRLEDIKRGEMAGIYRKGSHAKVQEGSDEWEERDDEYRYDASDLAAPDREVPDAGEDASRPSQRVDVWEIYTSLDIDKDGLLEPVIIRMAHDVILSVEENPYGRPPFRMARAIESPFRLEGVPYPQSLAQLQVELTQMGRLLNDATAMSTYGNLITNDSILAESWANRSIGDVMMAQNSTMNQKAYDILRPPPADLSILKTMETIEGRAERISGVTRYNQGIDANSLNKTATGINIIASLSQQRQRYMANVISETWKDILEDMVQCFKLFGEPCIGYFAGKGNEINPADYANDFTIQIELGIGPQEKQQQAAVLKELISFAQMAAPAGLMNMGHVAKAIDRMGQLLGVPLESYHYTEEEMQQMQQQKAMQAQAAQQAAAAAGGAGMPPGMAGMAPPQPQQEMM